MAVTVFTLEIYHLERCVAEHDIAEKGLKEEVPFELFTNEDLQNPFYSGKTVAGPYTPLITETNCLTIPFILRTPDRYYDLELVNVEPSEGYALGQVFRLYSGAGKFVVEGCVWSQQISSERNCDTDDQGPAIMDQNYSEENKSCAHLHESYLLKLAAFTYSVKVVRIELDRIIMLEGFGDLPVKRWFMTIGTLEEPIHHCVGSFNVSEEAVPLTGAFPIKTKCSGLVYISVHNEEDGVLMGQQEIDITKLLNTRANRYYGSCTVSTPPI